MTFSQSRVLRAGSVKVALDNRRLPLGAPEVGAHRTEQLGGIAKALERDVTALAGEWYSRRGDRPR